MSNWATFFLLLQWMHDFGLVMRAVPCGNDVFHTYGLRKLNPRERVFKTQGLQILASGVDIKGTPSKVPLPKHLDEFGIKLKIFIYGYHNGIFFKSSRNE